jgi:hypothetical protein
MRSSFVPNLSTLKRKYEGKGMDEYRKDSISEFFQRLMSIVENKGSTLFSFCGQIVEEWNMM